MDFDMLTRRELQTLCKRNKIPANMTNVAMIHALKSLEIVDGIEELLLQCQSETAQSSIESPVRSEVTSPYLPPTGGRSTRRRNVAKEESETVKPMTRTRRTARKTLVKDADEPKADAIGTPSVVSQTNRKKVQMSSACRKMDSQLKECVDEEKKDVLVTPAPSGVARRRRASKEESTVKRVYSTRRSARLAEKNMVVLNEKENENENSATFKKDLFANDQNVEMNLKESLDYSDEVSEITGIHETSEEKEVIEAVTDPEQDISVVGGELVNTIEEETGNNIEANGSKPEVKEGGEDEAEIVEEDSEKNEEVISAQEQNEPVSTLEEEMANHFDADVSKQEMRDVGDVDITMNIVEKDEVEIISAQEQDVSIVSKEVVSTIEEETHNISEANDVVTLNYEEEDKVQVVSAQVQGISVVSEEELMSNIEEETGNHFEVDGFKPEVKEVSDVDITLSFEKKYEVEVVSAQEQTAPIVSEAELLSTSEEETGNHFEADGSKQKVKEGSDVEIQKVGVGFETETAPDELKCYKTEDPKDDNIVMPLNMSNEIQESDGSPDTSASELHISVENTEEQSTEKHADCGDFLEYFVLGNEDNFVGDEVSLDIDIRNETEEEIYSNKAMNSEDVTKVNVNEKVVEIKSEVHVDVSETILNPENSPDLVIVEEPKEESSNAIIQSTYDPKANMAFDISLMNEEDEAKMKLDVPNWNAVIVELSQKWDAIGEKNEAKQDTEKVFPEIKLENVAAEQKMPLDALDSDSYLTLTPTKGSATKKRLTVAVSDNKENIGSGSKLFLPKDRVMVAKDTAENVPKLDALSRRKLSKMLKEQLQINNKSNKSENENEAPTRQALQALSENR